jgi:uncharacterized membrane protein
VSELDKPHIESPHSPSAQSEDRHTISELRAEFASFWSAPLPRPEVLAKYNEAFPGCAERIVAMAEQQSMHRQKIESAVISGNVYSQKTGLWLGFLLALIVISSGAWLVYNGRVEWGAGFISVPLIALVSVFVLGKRDQNRQLNSTEAENPQQKLPFPE